MGVLREVAEADLSAYYDHLRDPETAAHAGFPTGNRDAFMAQWAKALTSPSVLTRTIVSDGVVVGNIGCWEADGRTLVGYWIGREYWGRGLATQALDELLRIVEARPLHGYVGKSNLASIRVLEKCGFVVVGERSDDSGIDELVLELPLIADDRSLRGHSRTLAQASEPRLFPVVLATKPHEVRKQPRPEAEGKTS